MTVLSRDSQRKAAWPAKKFMYPDSNLASTDGFRYALVLLRSPSDFVRIGCSNSLFKPSISSDANYHHSTSCQLPPADTKTGHLIGVDYMFDLVDFCTHSCFAGLIDISTKHDFGTYDENANEDPTYNPNSTGGKKVFMQYADNMLFKLTLGTTQVELCENVFRFDAVNTFTNVVRSTEAYDTITYRLQQRLALQQKLLKKQLEKIIAIRRNIEYLKLMNLIPFLLGFKKKMEIPYLSKCLQPYSSKKTVFFFRSNFKCQHFQYAQNEYFYVHGGTEFGTLSVKAISLEIMFLVCCLSCNVCVCAACRASGYEAQLFDMDMPGREYYPIPVMEFDGKR
ncbi:LOW QUALITY PROTEIN: ankyrin and armadillo repeat-containing protein [Sarcoramphus papa]